MNALLLVLANLIWAAQPTVVKFIPADRLGPFAIAFVPFFLVTPLLAPLLWRCRGTAAAFRPTAADWGRFAIAGIGGQIVAQLGMTWGSVIGQASSCVILYLLIPVLTAVLASVMLGEPITRLRIACLVIGLAGVLPVSYTHLRACCCSRGRSLAASRASPRSTPAAGGRSCFSPSSSMACRC